MEELIDVLDKECKLTGISKPKSKIHKNGLYHKTVHTWIVNSKGEILIQKRAPTKINFPNLWDISSAGHISAGETSDIAAIREIKEELGIDVNKEDLRLMFTVFQHVEHRPDYIDNEFNDVYLVKTDLDISKFKFQESEITEIKFIPFAEFKKAVETNDTSFVPHPEEYQKLLFSKLV